MKKLLSITVVALLIAGLTAVPASAKKRHRHIQSNIHSTTEARSSIGGSNAELMGNNGNSGQGGNSLGNILGGNIGGGK
ncbi:MAG: hypothetical protein JWL86_196 [Rhizobium sp.]|nr:hypothetical protein [Rhizobium sp.]